MEISWHSARMTVSISVADSVVGSAAASWDWTASWMGAAFSGCCASAWAAARKPASRKEAERRKNVR